ncbi:protein MTSS 1-like isoform X6 [Dreissena polymorpha]|uniref:protein MTSS 1-like isoform X6 n=1 Tax=Dreissena polymorpha TaxID=45954 RepID=UPI002264D7F1|nr:protein MTSS 1-like isoform X6 [Dreissena polymorpha]
MESTIDKEIGVFGGLFISIVSEMRGSAPVWEDFTTKATKLHTSLKGTLVAISAFLDAFQKIADLATGSRGATKELGTALTRLCMRHKAIETKLKKFTGTILDHLVSPLQECMEEWKKNVIQLDKEHAKDYKRAKQEIKKCSSDTMRLQKKVKKGKADMQLRLEGAMQDVNEKYIALEEQEKNALRTALIEERARFCLFVSCLKPFVDEEVGLLTEVTHLQEIMDSLCMQADSPTTLPPSSEQVIMDLKGVDATAYTFQKNIPKILVGSKTPPSSPSSLGSRKSSMCSINSLASSSSGSAQSHSPCHNKNIQQQTVEASQDGDTPEIDSTPSTPSENYPNTPSATSTWTNWPNAPNTSVKTENGRPHTISSAYEKSHTRPALSSQLFEPPPQQGSLQNQSQSEGQIEGQGQAEQRLLKRDRPHSTMTMPYTRPAAQINKMQPVLPPLGPKPKSRAVAPPRVPSIGEQPVYANLNELAAAQLTGADADKTPTGREPPNIGGSTAPKLFGDIDLNAAIRDLDNYTAALHGDFTPGDRKSKIEQNSLELAAAIKELEANTAALESMYPETQASQSSLHASSGYGTMNSTPASSEDPLATGDFVDTGQSDYLAQEQGKYNTIPRNSPVMRAAFQFKRPASTIIGMPSSALSRRSSMNTAKPPPPIRRTSSITQAPNPTVLQKFRNSPPRQLNNQPPSENHSNRAMPVGGNPNGAPTQHNHRRSLSASGGSEPEHAYAELTEIQASIRARQQQQQQQGQYPSEGQGHGIQGQGGYGVMSAPVTPQYAQPVTVPGQNPMNSAIVNSLNARFSGMSTGQPAGQVGQMGQQSQYQSSSNPASVSVNSQTKYQQAPSQNSTKIGGGGGADFPDLPPPPSEDELKQMEQIYSVPKQSYPQAQSYNAEVLNTSNSVQMRNPASQYQATPIVNPGGGVDMRQSLISELKAGNRLRKMSNSEGGANC